MKTINGGKSMKFGFAAVNAGQRNVNVEPQLIATSTDGGFRVTGPVTRALGLQNGDNIMFISNVDSIDTAISQHDETLVQFCEERGLEYGSPEAISAIHKEFDVWGIAKGIPERDKKGNIKKTTTRLSKNDRLRYVEANYEDMYNAAMESDNSEVIAAITREGVTMDEIKAVLCEAVVGDEIDKFKGSKLASPSGVTGTGVNLTFTDSNVYKQLKQDLGDDANKFNRMFDINLDDMQDVMIDDGFEGVTVKVLPLGDYTDKEPVARTKGESDNESATESEE